MEGYITSRIPIGQKNILFRFKDTSKWIQHNLGDPEMKILLNNQHNECLFSNDLFFGFPFQEVFQEGKC